LGDTEKNLQSALAKLSALSKKGIGKAKDSIAQSSHIVKVKLDITSLQREKKRLLADLGEEVFTSVKEKKLKSKLFDESIENIDSILGKIEEKNKELEAIGVEPPAEEASEMVSEETEQEGTKAESNKSVAEEKETKQEKGEDTPKEDKEESTK